MTRPMSEEREKLEPCPFCGSADCRVIGGPGTRGGPKYWAGCDHCSGRAWGDTEAEAIAAWNRRSTSSAAERGMREALEKIQGYCERRMSPPSYATHGKHIMAIVLAALSGIEPGEDEQARGQGRSAPISTDTKDTSND